MLRHGSGARHNHAGGIAGELNGASTTITDCFNAGTVKGLNEVASISGGGSTACYVGGIVGYTTNGSVTNCYNIGDLSSNKTSLGGISGYTVTATVFTNCYWYKGISAVTKAISGGTANNVLELRNIDMKASLSFTGFDFTNIWTIDEGISSPYLRALPKPSSVNF